MLRFRHPPVQTDNPAWHFCKVTSKTPQSRITDLSHYDDSGGCGLGEDGTPAAIMPVFP